MLMASYTLTEEHQHHAEGQQRDQPSEYQGKILLW